MFYRSVEGERLGAPGNRSHCEDCCAENDQPLLGDVGIGIGTGTGMAPIRSYQSIMERQNDDSDGHNAEGEALTPCCANTINYDSVGKCRFWAWMSLRIYT